MFLTPRVGVGVIVRDKEKFLLLKRKSPHGQGTWSSPGGHLEFGETLEQCAARETFEETSIILRDVRFSGVTNDFFEAENKHYITIWMECSKFEGEAKINSEREMSEIGWHSIPDMPGPLFLSFHKYINGNYYTSY